MCGLRFEPLKLSNEHSTEMQILCCGFCVCVHVYGCVCVYVAYYPKLREPRKKGALLVNGSSYVNLCTSYIQN